MVPSFIFLLFADVFMLVAALGNGTSVFSLFKREQPPAGGGGTKASCEARQSGR
jgi:hypothetical protein